MKKLYLFLCLLLGLVSCSEMEEFTIDDNTNSKVVTRFAGDEKYDVLGYGYDVTGEYLHPMSVRNPVLDIKKYERDLPDRLLTDTPSYVSDRSTPYCRK